MQHLISIDKHLLIRHQNLQPDNYLATHNQKTLQQVHQLWQGTIVLQYNLPENLQMKLRFAVPPLIQVFYYC
ncbi:hypothetical protein D3C87_1367010 [compost metagenome]